jgi:hypothetical protein
VLENQARAELLDLETLRVWERNPMGYAGLPGNAVDVIMKRNFAPPAERLRSIIARLQGVPALYGAARANLKAPPKEFTAWPCAWPRARWGSSRSRWPTGPTRPLGPTSGVRGQFDAANAAVVEATAPSPTAGEGSAARVAPALRIGADNYRAKLRFEEMVDGAARLPCWRAGEANRKGLRRLRGHARAIDPRPRQPGDAAAVRIKHPAPRT